MKQIKSQDDVISEFLALGNGIKRITEDITGEEYLEHKIEQGIIVPTTKNYKIGIVVSEGIIHEIDQRRKNRKDITHWAALVPYEKAMENEAALATELGAENICPIGWDTRSGQIKFPKLGAFYPKK